jgi:hypothetical protein
MVWFTVYHSVQCAMRSHDLLSIDPMVLRLDRLSSPYRLGRVSNVYT